MGRKASKQSIDMVGRMFGKWCVLEELKGRSSSGERVYKTKCSCGFISKAAGSSLRRGNTLRCRSCADKEHGLKMRGVERLGVGQSAANSIVQVYKYWANKRGLSFDISDERFLQLTKQHCYYCGAPPTQIKKRPGSSDYIYNGVDRVDNSLGYTVSNAVACCMVCNRIKMDHTVEHMIAHIRKMLITHESRYG